MLVYKVQMQRQGVALFGGSVSRFIFFLVYQVSDRYWKGQPRGTNTASFIPHESPHIWFYIPVKRRVRKVSGKNVDTKLMNKGGNRSMEEITCEKWSWAFQMWTGGRLRCRQESTERGSMKDAAGLGPREEDGHCPHPAVLSSEARGCAEKLRSPRQSDLH